jgi:hypothetical protein
MVTLLISPKPLAISINAHSNLAHFFYGVTVLQVMVYNCLQLALHIFWFECFPHLFTESQIILTTLE